jgi:hypothetical protein
MSLLSDHCICTLPHTCHVSDVVYISAFGLKEKYTSTTSFRCETYTLQYHCTYRRCHNVFEQFVYAFCLFLPIQPTAQCKQVNTNTRFLTEFAHCYVSCDALVSRYIWELNHENLLYILKFGKVYTFLFSPIRATCPAHLIKSRRMRWAGYVARMGEKRNVYRLLVGKPEGRDH